MNKACLLNFLLFFLPVTCMAQDHPYLERFQAMEIEGKVFLSWTLSAGNICNGVQVLRATDQQPFNRIGEIPGVCGSMSEDVDYTFFDLSPVPQVINHYRLELGNEGLSQILSIQMIGLPSTGYQIRPHPVADRSFLLFRNDNRRIHVLSLFDLQGKLILRNETTDDRFIIDRNVLPSGICLFTILDEDGRVVNSGKIAASP